MNRVVRFSMLLKNIILGPLALLGPRVSDRSVMTKRTLLHLSVASSDWHKSARIIVFSMHK